MKANKVNGVKSGSVILLITGEKGSAFRQATLSKGIATLTVDNKGLAYKGAQLAIDDSKKWDAAARLQVGNYIAARGKRVKIEVLTQAQAEKLACVSHTIARNGKEIAIRTVKADGKQYVASIEQLKGRKHFFQWESVKIKQVNKLHYAALVK